MDLLKKDAFTWNAQPTTVVELLKKAISTQSVLALSNLNCHVQLKQMPQAWALEAVLR